MANKHRETEELTIRKRKRTQDSTASRSRTSGSVVDLKRITAQRDAEAAQQRTQKQPAHGVVFEYISFLKDGIRKFGKTVNVFTSASKPVEKKVKPKKEKTPVLITHALTEKTGPEVGLFEKMRLLFIKIVRFFTRGTAVIFMLGTRKLTPAHRRSIKPLVQFIFILLVIIIPVSAFAVTTSVHTQQVELEKIATKAFTSLTAASDQVQKMDVAGAEKSLVSAQKEFKELNHKLGGINGMLISVGRYIPGKGKEAAAARDLARAGTEITETALELLQIQKVLVDTSPSEVLAQKNGVITTIETIHKGLVPAAAHLHTARLLIDDVQVSALPEDKRVLVQQVKDQVPVMDNILRTVTDLAGVAPDILGQDGERRYMVLFQNNRELRPTGGFIGSFAQISVRKGIVTQLTAPGGGIYDVAGQSTTNTVSPEPLHLVNATWSIQDANWFPNFPDSAKKVEWFYERSNGSTLDGVMTLTPDVIENLLAVTGPIDMQEGYGVTVDADNVYELLQARNADDPNDTKPKRLIGDLTPKLLNAVITSAQDPGQAVHLLALMKQSLDTKNILLFFNNDDAQRVVTKAHWSGEIAKTDKDYLYINHANIAGGKTDSVIDETVSHHADIQEDGSVINTVSITRVHKGRADNALENVLNVSYVRAYVPEGSVLLNAEGYELPPPQQFLAVDPQAKIDADYKRISGSVTRSDETRLYTNNEFGKTVFGGFMRTPVGESRTVTLTYKLPFKMHTSFWKPVDTYSLDIQKQPGMKATFFKSNITLPKTFSALSWFPVGNENGVYQLLLTDDARVGVIVTPQKK